MILSSQKIICMCPLDPPKLEKVFFMVGPHKRFMAGILPSRVQRRFALVDVKKLSMAYSVIAGLRTFYRWPVHWWFCHRWLTHQPSSWGPCHLQLMHWLWWLIPIMRTGFSDGQCIGWVNWNVATSDRCIKQVYGDFAIDGWCINQVHGDHAICNWCIG